jgi:xylan 1,4-beta-xylosidase
MPTYKNPILPGFYPDPSICRVGSDYYLVTSSFAYFPGVPIFHSRDLVNFTQLGHVLDRPSQLKVAGEPTSAGIFAPTIRYHAGIFYMTTTNVSGVGNFIVTATDPKGPWSDPIRVEQKGIDPSLFFDDNGKVYYTTSHEGALQSEVDIKTGALLTAPRVVWKGTGGQYPEGPHLYKINGIYYLLLSEGGTEYGHMLTMARSSSPWGPFEPCERNPLLSHRSQMSPIQGTGHADLVQTESGDWFGVCLAFRPKGYPPCYHLGRETFLFPVTWSEDGFPVFGSSGRLELEHEVPHDLAHPPPAEARDDFDTGTLALTWNYLRNPDFSRYSLEERAGFLRLKGSGDNLEDLASPAWLGRRQCHFTATISTAFEFEPTDEREEAGLTVRMDEKHHYEIFLTRRQGTRAVVLRRRLGTLKAEVASRPLPEARAPLFLTIRAEESKYAFFFGLREGELEALGEGETRYLSTEVAGGFTGVYFALYASGNGAPCKNPADFDWFEYRPATG